MTSFGRLISFGGVILKDESEKIICKNTLDLRTEMTFQQLLPEIRKIRSKRQRLSISMGICSASDR